MCWEERKIKEIIKERDEGVAVQGRKVRREKKGMDEKMWKGERMKGKH